MTELGSAWDAEQRNISYDEGDERIVRTLKRAGAVLLALLVVLSGIAFYLFVYRTPKAVPVELNLTVPTGTLNGAPATIGIEVANPADVELRNVTLTLLVPGSVDIVGASQEAQSLSIPVGTLAPQGAVGAKSTYSTNVQVIAHGSENTVHAITAKLHYETEQGGSNVFEVAREGQLAVGGSAVPLTVTAPQRVAGGKPFTLTVRYKNSFSETLEGARLKLTYPADFTVDAANPKPTEGTGTWVIPSLGAGQGGEVSLVGSIPSGASTGFPFYAELSVEKVPGLLDGKTVGSVVVSTQEATVTSIADPLSVQVVVNGTKDPVVMPGGMVGQNITIKNVADYPIRDIVVTTTFLNPGMLNLSTVSTDGTFNSVTNVIRWDGVAVDELRQLAPGESAELRVSAQVVKTLPVGGSSSKNFTVKTETTATSPTLPPNTAGTSVSATTQSAVKVAGSATFDVSAYYREPTFSISNTGPYPPKVNQKTTYTIHWKIGTFATELKDVTVRTKLPAGVSWTNVTASNIASKPQYDSRTGEVAWQVPTVGANRGGSGGAAIVAAFQIAHTPAVNQVGREVTLAGESIMTATDAFTGKAVSLREREINSTLPDDTRVQRGGAVIQ